MSPKSIVYILLLSFMVVKYVHTQDGCDVILAEMQADKIVNQLLC